jgi:hypothetical protein
MTTITPPKDMPVRFDEAGVEREGAHGYDMGKSPYQGPYAPDTRLAKAWTRGWYCRKADLETKS